MSRHRSPAGRRAHPRQLPAPAADRAAPPASAALRNGLTAAALAGAALAVVTPAVTLVDEPARAVTADAGIQRLAADVPTVEPAGGSAGASIRMVASLAPVAAADEPPPPTLDAAELLKAVGLEDLARRAEEERIAREARANCDVDTSAAGQVKPWVRDAARFLSCLHDRPTLIGVAQRSRASDHPTGHALDLMTSGERGDRIADCALANQEALGITYVIWEQRVNYGDGWERMGDRGGDTANHMDHVHISFEKSTPPGEPAVEVCD